MKEPGFRVVTNRKPSEWSRDSQFDELDDQAFKSLDNAIAAARTHRDHPGPGFAVLVTGFDADGRQHGPFWRLEWREETSTLVEVDM